MLRNILVPMLPKHSGRTKILSHPYNVILRLCFQCRIRPHNLVHQLPGSSDDFSLDITIEHPIQNHPGIEKGFDIVDVERAIIVFRIPLHFHNLVGIEKMPKELVRVLTAHWMTLIRVLRWISPEMSNRRVHRGLFVYLVLSFAQHDFGPECRERLLLCVDCVPVCLFRQFADYTTQFPCRGKPGAAGFDDVVNLRVGALFQLAAFFDVFWLYGVHIVQASSASTVEFVAVLELMAACAYGVGNVNIRNGYLLAFCDRPYRSDVEFAFVKGVAGVGVATMVEPGGAGVKIYTAPSAIGGCQSERICVQLQFSKSQTHIGL